MSAAITTTSLTKRYGATRAVDGLSLDISTGTVYGFLGPNGAGKSTTMQMLTALIEPTGGDGTIMGTSIRDRRAISPQIGYLPETPPLYDALSGREQLDYVADLRDMSEEQSTDRIETLLREFDLVADAGMRIDAYSKGMRQKVAFIQAIIHDPDVLFLDEPTSGLDPRATRTLKERIRAIADSGMTIFLSTHILSVVDELADIVGVLNNGRLVAEGTPDGLKHRVESGSDGSLEDVFFDVTSTWDWSN